MLCESLYVVHKEKKMKITLSKSQWESIGNKAGWTKESQVQPFPPATYKYYINLDERGSFYADVRNSSDKTVFEIKTGNELAPGETSIFEDGFMKDKNDLEGLRQYLIQLGIMKSGQQLVKGN